MRPLGLQASAKRNQKVVREFVKASLFLGASLLVSIGLWLYTRSLPHVSPQPVAASTAPQARMLPSTQPVETRSIPETLEIAELPAPPPLIEGRDDKHIIDPETRPAEDTSTPPVADVDSMPPTSGFKPEETYWDDATSEQAARDQVVIEVNDPSVWR